MARKNAKSGKEAYGLGYLYKRDRTGAKVAANSKADGVFWLRARWADGKTADRRLLDDDCKPVRDLKTALAIRRRIRAPFLTGSRLAEVEAQISEAEKLRSRQAEEQDRAEPPLTIKAAWAEYVRAPNRRPCGERTLANYRMQWEAFARWLTKHHRKARYLSDITSEMAEGFAAELSSGKSANTYNKYIQFLRSMFLLLRKPARLAENPFSGIRRRRQVAQSRRTLTQDELRTVITSASGELRTLLEIGIYTGLRLGDCCTLEWREVDLGAGVIRRVPRKTAHSSGAVVEIGIPHPLANALAAIIDRDERYVLPGMAKRYEGNPQGISRTISQHLEKCGLQTRETATDGREMPVVRVSFHSLRHTWVSLQAEGGTPAALIQKAAGHSNPAMTEHYTHIGREGLRKMAAAVDMDFAGDAPEPDRRGELLSELADLVRNADAETLEKAVAALRAGYGRTV